MNNKDEKAYDSQPADAAHVAGSGEASTKPGSARAVDESAEPQEDVAIIELREKLEEARQECDALRDKYLRSVAELDNTRRRTANELQAARKFAVENFAQEMLSVRDSLELAMGVEIDSSDSTIVAKMKEGLDLTLKQMDGVFGKFSIEQIDPQAGDRLDPEIHQAMTLQESADIPPNHVLSVVQKGYRIHDRLLRPAMVIVAKAAAEPVAKSAEDDEDETAVKEQKA